MSAPRPDPDVRIRDAVTGDHSVLVDFNCRLARESEGRELDRARVEAGVRSILGDPGRGRYYVAERAGQVVACLLITHEYSDWRHGTFWWIQSVFTTEAARGEGVFKRLHAHVRALAKADPGVCGLRLYVEHENRRARETYERRGMKQTGYLVYEEDFTGLGG